MIEEKYWKGAMKRPQPVSELGWTLSMLLALNTGSRLF
jgi:hypothetical protein